MLIRILMCYFLCEHMFLFLSGTRLGVELLGHTATPCFTMWGMARPSFHMAALFYVPTSSLWGSRCLHVLTNTCDLIIFILAMLLSVKWFSLQLSFIFPWDLVMVSIFLCAHLPLVYLKKKKKGTPGAPGWLNDWLLISAQVMISEFESSNPASGSVLTVWSVLGILPLPLSLPLPYSHVCARMHSLSLWK